MAGTTEGREIAEILEGRGYPLLLSVATPAGRAALDHFGERVRVGPLSQSELEELISEKRVQVLVDATHPFAAGVRTEALRAARTAGVSYLRFERPAQKLPDYQRVIAVPGFSEAAEVALDLGPTIFLTIGHRNLEVFVGGVHPRRQRFVARILPVREALEECIRLEMGPQDIVAIWGPFTKELNLALFRQFEVSAIVTKDSGREGAVTAKIEAARELELPVVVIERPSLGDLKDEIGLSSVATYRQLTERIERMLDADRR